MALPFGPPLLPMLAKLRDEIPRGGGWLYEPKWDGFRTVVFRDGDVDLRSRNDRPLGRYFPEVATALEEAVPASCVLDGEIVLPTPDGLDFDGLQLRLHPAASRVELLAEETPASFVAFDVLALDGDDLRDVPLDERLVRLDAALGARVPGDPAAPATEPGPRVSLTPRTTDPEEASRWFTELEGVGLDGVIAKRLDLPYRPKERVMVKVKHRRVADCVVGGYRLSKDGEGVGSLLLGVYDADGVMRYVGHTSSFKARERRELLERLRPLEGDGAFPDEWGPGGPSRWTQGKDMAWTPLEPVLVCEVSYDHLQGGHRFRHAATFRRWREDKDPSECSLEQLRRASARS